MDLDGIIYDAMNSLFEINNVPKQQTNYYVII